MKISRNLAINCSITRKTGQSSSHFDRRKLLIQRDSCIKLYHNRHRFLTMRYTSKNIALKYNGWMDVEKSFSNTVPISNRGDIIVLLQILEALDRHTVSALSLSSCFLSIACAIFIIHSWMRFHLVMSLSRTASIVEQSEFILASSTCDGIRHWLTLCLQSSQQKIPSLHRLAGVQRRSLTDVAPAFPTKAQSSPQSGKSCWSLA